ncbi:MAG TPA: 2-oxoacid:acceptor oxidoreductase subunit alpha [Bacteroidales bacterium]|jgi:2-oxoglutarate ferredoxin oxidoreductase subunit alpha|nr:2-oxoacid:acceptor oxidoreductase subunit alpha [Bacteroidales bacterium]MDI9552698.1 2-oxoacid:acceptor oxidoreductase subunit alpha [Bacteroidota bacterium]MZP66352.1 2-oxoacid:acceptor oxidoreductase subunit alpha [Bacteroidales bacterium]NLK55678.1 2-oxoacid:acceptor oxidoreductase subunit alpha [Bacteroidales bacterium]HNY53056.1 2-oxoacid:acceptor oxidoreductase subunit alpha [Bacteroidales bacterium]
MRKKGTVIEKEDVVIRFSGDSGDGMQLTGTLFSETAALYGNDLTTFPDYPAEIRAPQGTVGGVSGFQVHLGQSEIYTPGDYADVLVAMNPAAIRANIKWTKFGGTIIIDKDNFTEKNIEKAGYESDPVVEDNLDQYNLIEAPISSMVKEALKDLNLDPKTILRTKNMFALGMVYWLFDRKLKYTEQYLEKKFRSKPELIEANKIALHSGYYYAETIEALAPIRINPAPIAKGKYRNISGNTATAWGLLAAAEKSGLELFIGSYPITPATGILEELAARKDLGVKSFQAEDEIAGICSALGASFAGNLAVTTTSGPGLALKSEAIGLAVMTELPIVIVDVQRGGPSTGLPTKTEQADLLQALFGRNGESPVVVLAASTPTDCFRYAFEAARIAVEHMTPVILLTDGYLANGTEPWRVPAMKDLPEIHPPFASNKDLPYVPYKRDPEKLSRFWAVPGTPNMEHRIGGLEKTVKGTVSYVPENHELMVNLRNQKVARVAAKVPDLEVSGEEEGDLLVVGWGGSYGYRVMAVKELQAQGYRISNVTFNYINPLPGNVRDVFSRFKKIVVCELNLGQFANYLRMKYPEFHYEQITKVQGLPFTIKEIKEKCLKLL